MPNVQHKRGTKAALDALATSSSLRVGQLYFITDQSRIAIATAVNAYQVFAKHGQETFTSAAGPVLTIEGNDQYRLRFNLSGVATGYLSSTTNAPLIVQSKTGLNVARFNEPALAAANYLDVLAGSTGQPVLIATSGDDTNIDLEIRGKNAGSVKFTSPIDITTEVKINGSAGVAGQVMRSQGPAADVVWSTLPNVTVGNTAPASPSVGDLWVDTN